MIKIPIKVNQIWQSKRSTDFQVIITGKKNDKFNTKILTNKTGVYNGTHKLARNTLYSKFILIK